MSESMDIPDTITHEYLLSRLPRIQEMGLTIEDAPNLRELDRAAVLASLDAMANGDMVMAKILIELSMEFHLDAWAIEFWMGGES